MATHHSAPSSQVAFTSRDFYDLPKLFLIRVENQWALFDGQFSEGHDEYARTYQVYLMGPTFVPPGGSWEGLADQARSRLGSVPVTRVELDPSRRRWFNRESLVAVLRELGYHDE